VAPSADELALEALQTTTTTSQSLTNCFLELTERTRDFCIRTYYGNEEEMFLALLNLKIALGIQGLHIACLCTVWYQASYYISGIKAEPRATLTS